MDGYYDPIVTHVLSKPLAICGVWGASIPDIGAYISSYTGISFIDLERKIEHHLGRSLYHYVRKEQKIIDVERACLEQLIHQPPYSVIALRPETLFDPRCANMVQDSMDLVFVDVQPEQLQQGLEKLMQAPKNNRFFQLDDLDWHDQQEIVEYFSAYRQTFQKANHIIVPQKHHPRYAAHEVIKICL